jgi:BirA family biotin operon repressor/biotin-[acetyl-CoA-carboxylase] ligase
MAHSEELLRILADGRFHSGVEIGRSLGISRTAVHNAVHALQGSGIDVFAVAGKGYRLPQSVELLDRDAVRRALSPAARLLVPRLDVQLSLKSTNAYLMQSAHRGAPSGTVCFAEIQTAGRGRRGREWVSPFGGNLYMSVLWRYTSAAAVANGLSPALGVAVAEALHAVGVAGVELKWPNDVVWNGRKLAGVLLELAGESTGPCHVVAGIGVNVAIDTVSGARIDQPWVDVSTAMDAPVARNRLAGTVLEHVVLALQQFEFEGFMPFLKRWRARDAFAGKHAQLQLPQEELHGTVGGVDERGALLFFHEGKTRTFAMGELSLREVRL